MGRRYLWHKVYEYEVPHNPAMKVEQNADLEWREEKDEDPEDTSQQPVDEIKEKGENIVVAEPAEEVQVATEPPKGPVAPAKPPKSRTIPKK
jgi:hypothetical protein